MAANPSYITMIPGTKAKASEVNTNWGESATAFTQIDDTNFATFGGVVSWVVADSAQAIDIVNSSSAASEALKAAYSGKLGAGKAGLRLTFSGAEDTGDAAFDIDLSNASTTIPALRVNNAGGTILDAGDSTDLGLRITDAGNGNNLTIDAINNRTLVLAQAGVSSLSFVANGIKIGSPTTGPELVQDGAGQDLILRNTLRLFDANGPKLSRADDGELLLETKLHIGLASGPSLSGETTDILLIEDAFRLKDINGPLVGKGSASNNVLQVQDAVQLGTSGVHLSGATTKALAVRDSTNANPFYSVVSEPSNDGLRVVRGVVNISGSSIGQVSGEGFTPTALGNNAIRITFTNPFIDTPAVQHNVDQDFGTADFTLANNISPTSVDITAIRIGVGDAPGQIHFTITGRH